MSEINRNHKDELFSYIFREKEHFKALYEYLTKKKLDSDIEPYTLDDNTTNVLFNSKLVNDVAFKTDDNKLIIMVEHQSTNNPNMALRLGLYYFNSVYKYMKDNSLDVFGKTPIQIPKPELYVVYNGTQKMKENVITLAKNFHNNEKSAIDISVKSIDINYLSLEEMTKSDKTNIVNFYSYFIQQIREKNSINEVIKECKTEGFTFDYLENKEWINMALKEYTVEDRIRDEVEERVEGILNQRLEVMVEQRTKPLEDENAKLKAELEKYKAKEKEQVNLQATANIFQSRRGGKSVEIDR